MKKALQLIFFVAANMVAGAAFAQTYTLGTAPATNGATITTCSGSFFDSGGAGGNYGNNEDVTVTFTSPSGTPMILSFLGFSFAAGEQFFIYNGPNTSSPQFTGSPLITGSPLNYIATGGSITIRFVSNASAVSTGWEASVFCASETNLTACSGSFTDPGGAGNYAANTAVITHLCSNNGGQARLSFSSFATEINYDYLYIYDGNTISSPQVAGSPFTGTTSPGVVTATGTCLTLFFVSDISGVDAGWNSTISCVPACAISSVTAIPACSGATYNVSGSVTFANPPTSGTLTISDGAATQTFSAPFTSPQAYTLTGLAPGSGSHTVTATFSATSTCTNTANYTAPASCLMGAEYVLGATAATVNTCSGTFADGGDVFANYGNSMDQTVTFCSTAGSNDQVTATFLNFNTEAGNDLLYIYDGPNTSSPQVPGSPFSGVGQANSPGVVTASGTCLTFRFVSNGSVTAFGWEAELSCSGNIPAAAPPAPTWTGYPGTACTPNTKIEGTVFEDFDDDGVKDAAEPFVKDVEVRLYDNTGQVGAAVLTNVSGLYSFTGLTASQVYRVEFTVPSVFEAGAYGSGSGTAVQFIRAGTCSANLGLLDQGRYCGLTNPKWTTPCYNNGDPMHSSNSAGTGIARFDYNASGQSPAASYQNWVTFGSIGTVWGTAYRRQDATLYMASVLRRHTGLGPGGVGAIYKRADSGTNTSSTVFYDFGAAAGTVSNNATRFPGTGTAFGQVGPCGLCDNLDPTTFGQIGKTGLGDIDLSTDESVMYVTNLYDRKVYAINMNNPTPGSATPLPNQPWLSGSPCTNGTARPWALKTRRGKLYVGVVCDGSGSSCSKTAACSDLTATVYSYDGASWSTVITYPLTYYRKAYAVGSNYWVRWMDNWSDFTANYANVTDAQFAQPLMVDIEFDDDGSMIMGFGDRTAMQTGYQAPPPPGPTSSTAERTFAHGDLLRAYFNPSTSAFTLENNGVAGPLATTNPSSTSGPGGKSFYWGDYWYGAQNNAGIGALAMLPGSGEIMFPKADPIDPYAAGVSWMSNTNGKQNRVLEVYQGSSSGNAPNFAKNGGLGDIELHCASAPIEIGNYIWWDHNLNGRMDPSEPGIPNVTVRLYLDPDGNTQGNNPANGDEVLAATTTTDNYGRYIFSFSGASNGLNAQTWQAGHTRVLPATKYQIRINNFSSDAGLVAYNTSVGSLSFVMAPTQNQGAAGIQRDNNAYASATHAAAAVLTTTAGENNHSIDMAFGPGSGCALVAAPTANTPCAGETLNLEANPTNGTAPFTYAWAGPSSFSATSANPSINNATTARAGTYTVTITDANNCTASMSILVEVNSIAITATVTSASSCGMSNGSIDLSVSDGISPYNYDWNDNALDGTEDPTGLAPGTYTVTVTDNNGCSNTAVAAIGSTGGPVVTVTPTATTCNQSNGTLTVTVSGGSSPYTFDWAHIAGASNAQNLTNVAAGTYNVVVTDNLGCVAAGSGVVAASISPSVSVTTLTNTSCNLSNGAVNITASGGTPPYTYDWAHIAGTSNAEDLTGLAPGTYTVTVTDGSACTVSTTAVIAPSTGMTASTVTTNEQCAMSNGAIDLSVSGGSAPYTYDWNNDGTGDNNDAQDLSGLSTGTYAVTVTDNAGCTAAASASITSFGSLTLTTVTTDATSCLANNGTVNLTVTGGNVPYVYDWNNDGHAPPDYDTEDLNNLTPGNYTVTVTDEDGCTATTTIVIGLTTGATVTAVVTDPTNCAQMGSVNLTVTGGSTPYTFDWNNIAGTNNPEDQSGLAAGVYRVTVTEANGCTTVRSFSIRDIREPVPVVTVTNPGCGMTNGAIDLEIAGGDGVGPYTYDWSNLPPTSDPQDQSGLGAGNYTVTVTDELQCTSVLTVNLSSSAAPELTIVPTNGTCAQSNGTLDLSISGGAAPYTIDWDNVVGASDPEDQSGLGAGTYAVTVTDNVGCTAVGNIALSAGALPTVVCTATAELDNGANGSISVDAAEVGPFTFDWNVNALDGQQNPTGLSAGTYVVTVTDAFSCTATCATVVAATYSCVQPTANLITVQATCTTVVNPDNNGRIVLMGILNADRFGVSAGATYTGAAYGLSSAIGTLPFNIQSNIPNAGGTYTVRFFNGADNCYRDYTVVVPDRPCPTDPMGFIYCEETGRIITSGTIAVSGPGLVLITRNGSDGTFQFYTDGTAGTYTVIYTPPAGYMLSTTHLPSGTLDPTGQPNPYVLGSNSTNGVTMDNFTPGANPYYFSFTFQSGDPEILLNNIPLKGCCVSPTLTVSNGQICNGGNINLASLVNNAGGGSVTFHTTLADAQNDVGALASSTVSPSSATNYYVRSELNTVGGQTCYTVKEVTVTIKATNCGVITITGPN